MRNLRIWWLLVMGLSAGAAGQTPAVDGAPPLVFRSSANLVVRLVVVKDRNGHAVKGLRAQDFTLTEDGVAQTISVCEFQQLDGDGSGQAPAVKAEAAAGGSGAARFRDRRLLAMYFDMTAMPVADQLRALTAARKFVESQMGPRDLVALYEYSGGGVRVDQDFTADRAVLLARIGMLIVGEGQGVSADPNDASSTSTGAAFGQDDREFTLFNTDRQLAALQTAVNTLSKLQEKKILLYFSSGLRSTGMDNHAQLAATIHSAVRAGVSLWPLDARGLVAQAPLGDATQGAPGGVEMYTGASAFAASSNLDRSQDSLWTLAADTGGKALLNYNDLSFGIRQARDSLSSYYILGYYTTNSALDGRYRRVHVKVTSAAPVALDYTPGYYAGKTFSQFGAVDKERQLEEALMLDDPITELPIGFALDYFRLNASEYFVPANVRVRGDDLSGGWPGRVKKASLDFIGEVKDQFGATITNLRDRIDLRLDDANWSRLAHGPIDYSTGFTLFPGRYTIKFLVRDNETGRIGTYQSAFVIPNLDKESVRVPISSVVLSSQTTDVGDALYTVKKRPVAGHDPLVSGSRRLVPSVDRVFAAGGPLRVYLEAYPGGGALRTYLSLYRGGAKVMERAQVVRAGSDGGRAVPIRFDVRLKGLEAGPYTCQVSVLAPDGGKAAFWRGAIVVGP